MKTIKFVAYLFFRYYSTGPTKDIPYFCTLCALVMLIGLHFFQIVVLFNLNSFLPTSSQRTKLENYLAILLFLAPVFILTAICVKKSDLEKMNYDKEKIAKGNILLIVYIVASIATLLLLVVLKKGGLGYTT